MNLVLGGTHGLGWQITKELQSRSEETFVTGRSYEEDTHGAGMKLDLANYGEVNKFIRRIGNGIGETATKRFFWVAGHGYVGNFADQPNPARMAKVNYANVLNIAQVIWRDMVNSDSPTNFVVVSSTTARRVRNNETVYGSSKSAQATFAQDLGAENERLQTNSRVALFLPGGMQTEFWRGAEPASFDEFLDPSKVASHIVERVFAQTEPYYEETIERGSL